LRCVLAMGEAVLRDVAELQRQVADVAEFVARQNAYLIRKLGRRRIPPIFGSGVLYRLDPEEWGGSFQHFPDAATVLERGWTDCKGAVPYRLADLREQYPAENFAVHTYPRRNGKDTLIHLQVRLPTGEIEDPSRLLHQ
jgi:hypothetical protein